MKSKRSNRQFAARDSPPSPKRPSPGQTHLSPRGREQLPAAAHDKESSYSSSSSSRGLHILRLLLRCAECVSADDLGGAAVLLPEIAELSSPFGTPPERVAAYFAHALQARVISSLLPPPPPYLKALAALGGSQSQTQRIFNALQCYNSISPLIKFSHFTANQAILEALDGEDRVHVIDLDIMQGLQWPGLFHILAASRSRAPLRSLRITGFGSSLRSLEATGQRLGEFATSLGLPFEFTPLESWPGALTDPSQLGGFAGEATVVHWAQHSLYDGAGEDDLATLRLMALLKPKLVTIVERDLDLSRPSQGSEFLARFVEALHYYSALFDALGEGLGEELGEERHAVERGVFGREIRNVIGRFPAARRVGRWAEEMRRVGFRRVSLGGAAAAQAGMLLGMVPWNKGYTLMEEKGCLKLGWKDLSLLTASAWEPSD